MKKFLMATELITLMMKTGRMKISVMVIVLYGKKELYTQVKRKTKLKLKSIFIIDMLKKIIGHMMKTGLLILLVSQRKHMTLLLMVVQLSQEHVNYGKKELYIQVKRKFLQVLRCTFMKDMVLKIIGHMMMIGQLMLNKKLIT